MTPFVFSPMPEDTEWVNAGRATRGQTLQQALGADSEVRASLRPQQTPPGVVQPGEGIAGAGQ